MFAPIRPFDALRDQILALTSDFRNALRSLGGSTESTEVHHALKTAARAFRDLADRAGIEPLVHSGQVLERIAFILETLREQEPAQLEHLILAARDSLGTVEQLLDWCLGTPDAARQAQLEAVLLRSFPEAWRPLFEADPGAFENHLLPSHPVSRPAAEAAALAGEATASPILLRAFAEEAEQRFARSEELLVRLERMPEDAEVLSALLREFHTLKGAAAEVGLDEAQAQLHAAESLLASVRDQGAADVSAVVDLVLQVVDSVRCIVDHAAGISDAPCTVKPGLTGRITELLQGGDRQSAAEERRPITAGSSLARVPPGPRIAPGDSGASPGDVGKEELLERLQALDRQVREYSQITSKLQAQLDALRLVRVDEVLRRLVRPARDAARQEGKVVDVEVLGGDLRIDRGLVETLHGILLHLVRNAVTHGIERPAERQACGKCPNGTVRIHARQQSDHLVVRVDDDGAGLDFEAIQTRAEANGWLRPGELPTRQQLARFIFRRGFSTRKEVTGLAGRGVGLDVVAHEVEMLDGAIDVESIEGRGTSIRVSLPVPGTAQASGRGATSCPATEQQESQRGAVRLKLVHKKNGTTDKAS